jgi:hypothetical protein
MPWELRMIEESQIIETVFSGINSMNELVQAVQTNMEMGQKHGINRFLADCTALDGGTSLTDIFHLAEFYDSLPIDRHLKEAVLLPVLPDAKSDLQFFETTTRNRGFDIRVFEDRQAAIDWLLD